MAALAEHPLTAKFVRTLKHSDLPAGWADNQEIVDMAARAYKEMGTDSPFFRAWYAESPMRSGDGPIHFYHGTAGDHDVIDPRYVGEVSSMGSVQGNPTPQAWLTQSKRYAGEYAQNAEAKRGEPATVLEGFVNLQNPLRVKFNEDMRPVIKGVAAGFEANEPVVRYAKSSRYGHDWVWWENGSFTDEPSVTIFSPEHFKSVENRGTFDPEDSSFLRSLAPLAAGGTAAGGLMASPESAWAGDRTLPPTDAIEEAWNPVEALAGGLGGGIRAALMGVPVDALMDYGMGKIGGLMGGHGGPTAQDYGGGMGWR